MSTAAPTCRGSANSSRLWRNTAGRSEGLNSPERDFLVVSPRVLPSFLLLGRQLCLELRRASSNKLLRCSS